MMQAPLLIAGAWYILDQTTKWWLLEHVMVAPRVIEVTPFLNIVLGMEHGRDLGLV